MVCVDAAYWVPRQCSPTLTLASQLVLCTAGSMVVHAIYVQRPSGPPSLRSSLCSWYVERSCCLAVVAKLHGHLIGICRVRTPFTDVHHRHDRPRHRPPRLLRSAHGVRHHPHRGLCVERRLLLHRGARARRARRSTALPHWHLHNQPLFVATKTLCACRYSPGATSSKVQLRLRMGVQLHQPLRLRFQGTVGTRVTRSRAVTGAP